MTGSLPTFRSALADKEAAFSRVLGECTSLVTKACLPFWGETRNRMMSYRRKQSGPYCSRFGTIAVELGYLAIDQLKAALEEQLEDDLNNRPHRVIGAICFARGWMTPEQIDVVLNHMFKVRVSRNRYRESEEQAAV